jgi:hypothetical protein
MRTILIDDYIVVTAYVNQYCLHTFASLEEDANLLMLIKLNCNTHFFYKNKNFVQIGVHIKMHIKL